MVFLFILSLVGDLSLSNSTPDITYTTRHGWTTENYELCCDKISAWY